MASLVFGAIAVATTGVMVAVGACGGWLLALMALVFALVAISGRRQAPAGQQAHTGIPALTAGTALATALLIGQTLMVRQVWKSARMVMWTTVSSTNLTSLGCMIADYAKEKGTYPSTLQELLASDRMRIYSLYAPLDPEFWRDDLSQPNLIYTNSSYIYVPGHGTGTNDSKVILAYERRAFGSTSLRVFQRPERYVLFGDGQVEALDEDSFQRAWQQDRERRRQLGWPIPANEPTQPPASQPGPVVTWPAG